MLEDYKKAVISNYHEKKEKGLLSLNLSHPSPAKLREECLNVLRSRFDPKDESFVKEFFNFNIESNDYSHCIKKFDADRFRPLVKFMRSQIEDTADKNVELLAWLIGFEPRPYKFGVIYPIDSEQKQEESIEIFHASTEEEIQKNVNPAELSTIVPIAQPHIYSKWISLQTIKKIVPLIMLIFLVTGGVYLYGYSSKVYICDRGVGNKYHLNPKCSALKNCKNDAVSTTITEAKKNGKTLCGLED